MCLQLSFNVISIFHNSNDLASLEPGKFFPAALTSLLAGSKVRLLLPKLLVGKKDRLSFC